jgi:hypothetical protein
MKTLGKQDLTHAKAAFSFLTVVGSRVRQAAVTVLAAVSGLQGEELAALNRQLDAIAGSEIGDTDTGVLVDDYQVSCPLLSLDTIVKETKLPHSNRIIQYDVFQYW